MAAIPGLVEHVETEFGESILARDAAIARARREGCVGPPDLVWLQKIDSVPEENAAQDEPPPEPKGYYHWVLGKLPVSEAEVAAYFADLVNAQVAAAKAGVPGAIVSALSRTHELRGTLRITGGVYCTYDAFSQTDLRVAMLLPGGVSCKAQTPAGATPNVDPAWWSGAVVSGTARWLMVDAPAAAKADPTVRVFAPLFESPRHESRVLHASLVALAESGALAARQHRLAAPWDDARGSCAAEMESLSCALAHLLLRSRSRDAGARLLAQLAPLWPSAALPLSRALRDGALDTSDTPEHGGRGGGDASAADDAWLQVEDRDLGYHLLEEALTACEDPGSCLGRPGGAQRELARRLGCARFLRPLWDACPVDQEAEGLLATAQALQVAMGEARLAGGDAQGAAECCDAARELQAALPHPARPLWLLSARLDLDAGHLHSALHILDSCPPPPNPDPITALGTACPLPFDTTHAGAYDASLVPAPTKAAADVVAAELMWPGAERLATLPGAQLMPAAHWVLDDCPRVAMSRAGPAAIQAVYDVLAVVVERHGWLAFTRARAACFFMEADLMGQSLMESHGAEGRGEEDEGAEEEGAFARHEARATGGGRGGRRAEAEGAAGIAFAEEEREDVGDASARHVGRRERGGMEGEGRRDPHVGRSRGVLFWDLTQARVAGELGRLAAEGGREELAELGRALEAIADRAKGVRGRGGMAERAAGGGRRIGGEDVGAGRAPESGQRAESPTAAVSDAASAWVAYVTAEGQRYYHNAALGVTQWERPEGYEGGEEGSGDGSEGTDDESGIGGDEGEEYIVSRPRGGGHDSEDESGGESDEGDREGAQGSAEVGMGDARGTTVPGAGRRVGAKLQGSALAALGMGRVGRPSAGRGKVVGEGRGQAESAGTRSSESGDEGGGEGTAPRERVKERGARGSVDPKVRSFPEGRPGAEISEASGPGPGPRLEVMGTAEGVGASEAGSESAGSVRVISGAPGGGSLAGEEGEGADGGGEVDVPLAKVPISPWFDEVCVALWNDVQALNEWDETEEEQSCRLEVDRRYNEGSESGNSWGGLVDGARRGAPRVDDDQDVARVGPAYSQSGWLHLGLLALRLGLRVDAERAFRVCVFPRLHPTACFTASAALCQIYAPLPGMATECFTEFVRASKAVADHEPRVSVLPECLANAFFTAVAFVGLPEAEEWMERNRKKVGEQTQGGWLPSLLGWAAALAPGRAPKWQVLTDGAVRDAIKWRVPGYDRQPR